jgi:hypothetical protein
MTLVGSIPSESSPVNAAQPWAYPSLAQPHSPQVKSTSPGTGAIFGESLSPRKRPDGTWPRGRRHRAAESVPHPLALIFAVGAWRPAPRSRTPPNLYRALYRAHARAREGTPAEGTPPPS